jgi:hypothetical protein
MTNITIEEEAVEEQVIVYTIILEDNSKIQEIITEITETKIWEILCLHQLILETVILQIGPRTTIGDNNSMVMTTMETMEIDRMNFIEENHSKEEEEVEDLIITIEMAEPISPGVLRDLINGLKIATMKHLQRHNKHHDSKGTLQMIHNQQIPIVLIQLTE